MSAFRYAQFCPVARAAEIVGERWTLLIVRELLLGAKRFSDLRRPLAGISSSVLAERLARLEHRGIVAQRALPPPAPAALYELTESGRALLPVMIELGRWGTRFLGPPEPGDHVEPDWVRLALRTFAREGPSPAVSCCVTLGDGDREIAVHLAGGPGGTAVRDGAAPADVAVRVDSPLSLLALAAGALDPREAIRSGQIRAEGDLDALDAFPALFEIRRDAGSEADVLGPPHHTGD